MLRGTACVTSRPQYGRPAKIGRQVQPDDVLVYALAYPNTAQERSVKTVASQKVRFGKSKELGTHSCQPTLQQVYWTGMPSDAIHVALRHEPHRSPANILRRYSVEVCFHGIAYTVDRVPITRLWKILDVLPKFDIKCGLLLTFDVQFTITTRSVQYFTMAH